MAHAGQEVGTPGGMKLRLIGTGAETDGELLAMEATYPGDGRMPPMHLIPSRASASRSREVRPALRTAEFFERLYGEGPGSAREMGEGFFAEFDEEFRLANQAV